MSLTVGSVFSGIGGFDLGFERMGFTSVWRCELEPFCRKVLISQIPGPPIYGDVRAVSASTAPRVDVLMGGFPCQDVSIAGQRKGLRAARSGLFFEFVRLIRELRPRWWVIENVPGLLSNAEGADFATVLHELDDCGQVGHWRVLDSQYFGLAQRRARVFLVGGPRGRVLDSVTVLFESESGAGHPAASKQAKADIVATLRGRSHSRGIHAPGRGGEDDYNVIPVNLQVATRHRALGRSTGLGIGEPGDSAFTLQANHSHGVFVPERAACLNPGHEAKQSYAGDGGTLNLVAHALTSHSTPRFDINGEDFVVGTLDTKHSVNGHGLNGATMQEAATGQLVPTLQTKTGRLQIEEVEGYQPNAFGVRRLTPLECERLQGFPDGWTCLCGEGHRGTQFCRCKDGPRYKALGNAVSVPVAQWIAERILDVEHIAAGGVS